MFCSFQLTKNAWYMMFVWKFLFAALANFSFTTEWNSYPFSVIVQERVSDSLVSSENSVVSALFSVWWFGRVKRRVLLFPPHFARGSWCAFRLVFGEGDGLESDDSKTPLFL